jgi:hypothetical protein
MAIEGRAIERRAIEGRAIGAMLKYKSEKPLFVTI